MGAVTREARFERVILSEPLTLIPYALEMHPRRPDYNLPVDHLSIQGEQIFIHQLALWLCRVKQAQPARKVAYYIGSTHHYLILKYANIAAGSPFQVIPRVPAGGLKDYATCAKAFRDEILGAEESGIPPLIVEPDIEKWLKSRSGYTTRVLWREIHYIRRVAGTIQAGIEPVSTDRDYATGFGDLY
jgi:hypothetical protein